ncbi:Rv3654c family TadE-like protein [Gordonia sp. CPCC 205515]|uniref:Rv3654c family TadE-like protein n=1 Tax=Gordonia sp. CPCC 205515 TaxID=3140791 RepID=UPI003AF3E445
MTAAWSDDRGFATIVGAFAIAAVVAATIAVGYFGAAVVARHRAQSAADLAALAAAQDHVRGEPNPCATAQQIVTEQRTGAQLVRCAPDGADVVVRTAVPVPLGPFGLRRAEASARAGPID